MSQLEEIEISAAHNPEADRPPAVMEGAATRDTEPHLCGTKNGRLPVIAFEARTYVA